jgi:hypothetical protein
MVLLRALPSHLFARSSPANSAGKAMHSCIAM